MRNGRHWSQIGAILGGLSGLAGAFGAHGLEKTLNATQLQTFETAARYQMYHALAIVAVGLLFAFARDRRGDLSLQAAARCFLTGTLLFSGSLYAYLLGGPHWLVYVTPVGGLNFLFGWTALAIAGIRLSGDGREGV
ncbi:MAG: DUF423 domain-containing protein [Isosphaeraceae bacterium]